LAVAVFFAAGLFAAAFFAGAVMPCLPVGNLVQNYRDQWTLLCATPSIRHAVASSRITRHTSRHVSGAEPRDAENPFTP
jgi:hypothetical protein